MAGDPGRTQGAKDEGRAGDHAAEASTAEGGLQQELERLIGRAIELRSAAGTAGGDPGVPAGFDDLDATLDYRNFYLEFVEKSNDAMYVVDLFGNFKFVNRTAQRLIGYGKEELLGRNVSRFLYRDGLRKAVSVIAALVRGREVAPHEFVVKTASGDRVAEISVTLIRKGGFPIGILGVARDVTEHRAQEKTLRESEARLATVVENLPFDFFALDRKGRYTMQNSTCRKNWGDIVGKTPADLAPDPATLSQWEECNRRALNGETVRTVMRRMVNGVERSFYNVVSPAVEGGEVVSILGINMDITEQRRSEELTRVQRDLASSLAEVRDLEEGLEACLRASLVAAGMDCGGIYMLAPEGNLFELAVHHNLSDEFIGRVQRYAVGTPQGEVLMKGNAFFPDLGELPEVLSSPMLREGLKVLAVLPIHDGKNLVGCMNLFSRTMTDIGDSARSAMESLASTAGSAVARIRAKEELHRSEKKYREILANIPVVSWATDDEGNTVFVSPNVAEICGFSGEEICEGGHRLFLELVHPDDRPAAERAHQALFAEGAEFDIEYRLRHKEGGWRWLRDRAYSRRKEDGRAYAIGVFYEVTERKEAEEALRESEERYRSLVEHSKELVFTVSSDGTFTFVNKALEAFSDWSTDELLGSHLSDFIHQGDLALLEERIDRTLQGENLPSGEARVVMKSGEYRTIEYTISQMVRRGGVTGVLGVARDITERKRIDEDRRHLVALKERENISRWLHDNLGADLYNIILLADSIQRQTSDLSVVKQQVEWITETSRKSLASIRNYLDFSSQTGFTFAGLVSHMEQYGRSLLSPLGVRFEFEQSGDIARCDLSGVQTFSVYLIFKESLTNIVKHARASKVEVKVAFGGERLSIVIQDDGEGFTPDANLSGRFGTANLRARADEMGADLHVHPRPGKGTQVDFSLPVGGTRLP